LCSNIVFRQEEESGEKENKIAPVPENGKVGK
jgi:hypothetical protein